MENRKRRRRSSLPYLLLNVILSALTTLLVLWLWNRAQVNKMPEQFNEASNQQSVISQIPDEKTQAPLPPLPPLDLEVIKIVNVYGAGDLQNEVVVLQNVSGQMEIWLDGWRLEDADGNHFSFQSLVLNQDAQIQVFSSAGHDSVNSLHWNLTAPIWQSGETARLYDYKNNLRATFTIP